MKGNRKEISKKTRFDVFKRDAFSCQYCGATPPGVLLHIDHVMPVAEGGGNEIENLVTACSPCNLGKGARLLKNKPQSLTDKAAEVAEREAQLLEYQEILQDRRDRIEDEFWNVAFRLDPRSPYDGMPRERSASIKRFNTRLGVLAVVECAELALDRFPQCDYQTFRYFCGICWNKIRESEADRA